MDKSLDEAEVEFKPKNHNEFIWNDEEIYAAIMQKSKSSEIQRNLQMYHDIKTGKKYGRIMLNY